MTGPAIIYAGFANDQAPARQRGNFPPANVEVFERADAGEPRLEGHW